MSSTAASLLGCPDDGLWAITSYFNPMRYRRRSANYRIFRECLGVPLLVVELVDGLECELSEKDADILVQVRGGDVMWQKERLLNIGLRSLPSKCRKVAVVDCDIIFENCDWVKRAAALLDSHMIVQLFEQVHYLPPDWMPGPVETKQTSFKRPSIVSGVASGRPAAVCLSEWKNREYTVYCNGYAWAARKELLDQHGHYEACIVGGADRAMVCALYGCFDDVIELHRMNEQHRKHYLDWGRPFQHMVGGAVGVAEGNIFHLWHGEVRDRQFRERYPGLSTFQFDPYEDIIKEDGGPLRWNTTKYEMHEYVREFFSSRREDG